MNRNIIPSEKLTLADLPPANASWSDIVKFAATFDLVTESAKGTHVMSVADVSKNSAIVDLRTALYVEWRRYNHFGQEPDTAVLHQIQAVLEWIRNRLPN
jgi:hypothetical protein